MAHYSSANFFSARVSIFNDGRIFAEKLAGHNWNIKNLASQLLPALTHFPQLCRPGKKFYCCLLKCFSCAGHY